MGDVCPLVAAACDEEAGLLAAEREPFSTAGNGQTVRSYDWEWTFGSERVVLVARYWDGSMRPIALYEPGELHRVQRLVSQRNRHLLVAVPYWAHDYVEVLSDRERRHRWEREQLELDLADDDGYGADTGRHVRDAYGDLF